MSDLPAPPVPADCDLTGFNFMPLDCVRLVQSDLTAISTGDEFKAAVILWCQSWSQVPAGSMTDDDRVLAHAAGLPLPKWKKVKPMALRGWFKAGDGRLYHPVVASKVMEAWEKREETGEKTEHERERKRREREDRKAMFATLRAAGQVPSWNITTSDLRQLVTDLSHVTGHEPVTTGHEQDTARNRQGQGQGQGGGERSDKPDSQPPHTPPAFISGDLDRANRREALRKTLVRLGLRASSGDTGTITEWADVLNDPVWQPYSMSDRLAAVRAVVDRARRDGRPIAFARESVEPLRVWRRENPPPRDDLDGEDSPTQPPTEPTPGPTEPSESQGIRRASWPTLDSSPSSS